MFVPSLCHRTLEYPSGALGRELLMSGSTVVKPLMARSVTVVVVTLTFKVPSLSVARPCKILDESRPPKSSGFTCWGIGGELMGGERASKVPSGAAPIIMGSAHMADSLPG